MSGSLGGGRSKSYQESQSTSAARQESLSTSLSQAQQQSQSGQSIAFADIYSQLYGNASTAANKAVLDSGALTEAASQLFSGGSQFLESLGSDAGSQYLSQRLDANNPVLEQQIAQLQEDTGRLFREELNPAITSRAVSGGTLGGGRQGVAQGLAAEGAARTFTQGATALRAQDVAARDSVAQSIATNTLNAASTGLGSLPSLLNILQQGNQAELGIYSSLSSILGGPSTLTQSSSTATSTAQSLAESIAESFGQSSGYGRGSSWNFDTSFGLIGS